MKKWFFFALTTTLFWGIWGALIEMPEKAGFPATLGYTVWALTMVPCAVAALWIVRWKIEHDCRSVAMGSAIGFLGAGGQLILFQALRMGPAYLVFPLVSLSPVVTILLSCALLKERTGTRNWIGIVLALAAIPLLSYQSPASAVTRGRLWILIAFLVFVMWGIQATVMKSANMTMKAESIFFYMMLTGLALIPVALAMTDFSIPIQWGFKGPWLAALIQVLNSIGALCLVYAFRFGKAIIVGPLTNAVAPVITVVISLVLYSVLPHPVVASGIALALVAVCLMAVETG